LLLLSVKDHINFEVLGRPLWALHVQIRTCAYSVTVHFELFSSCKTYIKSVLDIKKCSYNFVQKIFFL